MNTTPIHGWIFYDAQCPLCRAAMNVLKRIFERRGFEWQPLQTPGAALRLGLSDATLLEEMKVQLADRKIVGGVDSWIVLFRSVWWLWPIGALLSLPGLHPVGQVCYRWTARHRYCISGRCHARPTPQRKRTIPFFDLP